MYRRCTSFCSVKCLRKIVFYEKIFANLCCFLVLGVDEGAQCLKSEAMSNDFVGIMIENDSCDGGSGHSEVLRTYKRRRHIRSSSKGKGQKDGRGSIEAAFAHIFAILFSHLIKLFCISLLYFSSWLRCG